MKFKLCIFLCQICLMGYAQTYTRISLSNFVLNGGKYVATTNITIAAGTAVQVIGVLCTVNAAYGVANPTPRALTVQYSGGPATYPSGANGVWDMSQTILGPCTLTLSATATNNTSPAAYAVLRLTTVSVTGSAPSAPTVSITLTRTNVLLAWPTNTTGVLLEYCTNLATKTWVTNTAPIYVINGQYTITNGVAKGSRYYRLLKP